MLRVSHTQTEKPSLAKQQELTEDTDESDLK